AFAEAGHYREPRTSIEGGQLRVCCIRNPASNALASAAQPSVDLLGPPAIPANEDERPSLRNALDCIQQSDQILSWLKGADVKNVGVGHKSVTTEYARVFRGEYIRPHRDQVDGRNSWPQKPVELAGDEARRREPAVDVGSKRAEFVADKPAEIGMRPFRMVEHKQVMDHVDQPSLPLEPKQR